MGFRTDPLTTAEGVDTGGDDQALPGVRVYQAENWSTQLPEGVVAFRSGFPGDAETELRLVSSQEFRQPFPEIPAELWETGLAFRIGGGGDPWTRGVAVPQLVLEAAEEYAEGPWRQRATLDAPLRSPAGGARCTPLAGWAHYPDVVAGTNLSALQVRLTASGMVDCYGVLRRTGAAVSGVADVATVPDAFLGARSVIGSAQFSNAGAVRIDYNHTTNRLQLVVGSAATNAYLGFNLRWPSAELGEF